MKAVFVGNHLCSVGLKFTDLSKIRVLASEITGDEFLFSVLF